jgi:alkyl hydroperoxide reductase subunit AhpC
MFDFRPNDPIWCKYFAFYAWQKKTKKFIQISAVSKRESSFAVSHCSTYGVSTDFQQMSHFWMNEPERDKYLAF